MHCPNFAHTMSALKVGLESHCFMSCMLEWSAECSQCFARPRKQNEGTVFKHGFVRQRGKQSELKKEEVATPWKFCTR